ncbi:MAG: hypothetical protein GEU78_15100 [Actinobacteria bacterium]|nr:hypothetical protein [Actinomycetota bacterium]
MSTRAPRGIEAEPRHTGYRAAGERAPSSANDKLAIVALACVGLTLGGAARLGASSGYSWLTSGLLAIGLGGLAAVLGWVRVSAGSFSRSHVLSMTEVWRYPERSRRMFLFGCLVALPVLALHTRFLLGDADSARLVASTLYVQRFGVRYLIETQEVLLPHLVLGPLMTLGGITLVKAFLVLSVIGLAGTVSYITWQASRSAAAALAGVLALLSFGAIDERAMLLPMYASMLAFGFLGSYFMYRGADQSHRPDRIRYAVFAAVCLLLCIESHQVGQLFLIAAPILLIFHRSGHRARTFLRTYGAFALFYLPRAAINLTEGGFSHFFTNRDDYWITQGHLVELQTRFWRLGNDSPLGQYISKSAESIFHIVGWPGILAVVLAVAAFFLERRRILWFGLTFALFFAVIVVGRRLPLYPRYFSQLLVGGAIAAGVAVGALIQRGGLYRVLGALSIVLLGSTAMATLTMQVNAADEREAQVLRGPYPQVAAAVNDDRGVVGARSTYLNFTRPDVLTYGGQFLTRSEFVTFLTWPSDRAVIDIMRNREIGWVIVPQRARRWVYRYHNTWLIPNYGRKVVYPRAVRRSPFFCHVLTEQGAELYKLSPPDDDERVMPNRECPD